MSAADAAWLHMDQATNPMVVNGLLRLGGVPEVDDILEAIDLRLLGRFPRFSQRVVERRGRTPAFEDDPGFDPRRHVHRLGLPAPGGKGALEELVSDLVSAPLDHTHPLWQNYLIETDDGGAALLWRMHHCIADGIALARVMLSLADAADPGPPARRGAARRGPLGRLGALAGGAFGATKAVAGTAVHESADALVHPGHLQKLGSRATHDLSTAAKLLASPADQPSALSEPLSGSRRVAWSDGFPLERVKESCHDLRVTVNDLLVTALAATLRECLQIEGRFPDGIHAMVPVNLRPLDQPIPADLGNAFALILLELPVGEMPPAERLRQVNSRMNEIKNSHEALISFGLLDAMGMTPPWAESRLVDFFAEKASLVVTNVPGPRERLGFCGQPVEGVLVWAPCSGSIGMTVSIFSYAGEVSVGFMTDTALVPDPEPLARGYEQALAELC